MTFALSPPGGRDTPALTCRPAAGLAEAGCRPSRFLGTLNSQWSGENSTAGQPPPRACASAGGASVRRRACAVAAARRRRPRRGYSRSMLAGNLAGAARGALLPGGSGGCGAARPGCCGLCGLCGLCVLCRPGSPPPPGSTWDPWACKPRAPPQVQGTPGPGKCENLCSSLISL